MEPENQEFLRLLQLAGWSQAEASRQLEISTSGINQIVKGNVKPSAVTLRLLRLLVSTSPPNSADSIPDYAADLVKGLGEIEPTMRKLASEAALGAIHPFPKIKKTTSKGRPSSSTSMVDLAKDNLRRNVERLSRLRQGKTKPDATTPPATPSN